MNDSPKLDETVGPCKQRVVLRFKLRMMLLLFIPVGLASLWLRENYLDSVPIDWQELSTEAYQQQLEDGRSVLVFQFHVWDMSGPIILKTTLETPEVRRAIRRAGVVPFLVSDYSKNAQLRELLPTFRPGHTTLVVCHPSAPSKPMVAHGTNKDELIDAIYGSRNRSQVSFK